MDAVLGSRPAFVAMKKIYTALFNRGIMPQQEERELHRKDPIALALILIGVFTIIAICIGIERLIPRY